MALGTITGELSKIKDTDEGVVSWNDFNIFLALAQFDGQHMNLIIDRVRKFSPTPINEERMITIWLYFGGCHLSHDLSKGLNDEAFCLDGGAGLMGGLDGAGAIAVNTE